MMLCVPSDKRIASQSTGAAAGGATLATDGEHVQMRNAWHRLSPADERAVVGIECVIGGWIDCRAGLLRHRAAAAVVHGEAVVARTGGNKRGGAVEIDRDGGSAGNAARCLIAGNIVAAGTSRRPRCKSWVCQVWSRPGRGASPRWQRLLRRRHRWCYRSRHW